jgi:dihydroorotate dehydrogenase electron transfer subunit
MYKQGIFTIEENRPLTASVYRMVLAGDTRYITAPGQFINIALEGKFLRRPISVCDYDSRTVTIIYKVVGQGTAQMAKMQPGEMLDVLTGLGNGYTIEPVHHALLIGGGVGVPPLYNLCKCLRAAGQQVTVILGFNTADACRPAGSDPPAQPPSSLLYRQRAHWSYPHPVGSALPWTSSPY